MGDVELLTREPVPDAAVDELEALAVPEGSTVEPVEVRA